MFNFIVLGDFAAFLDSSSGFSFPLMLQCSGIQIRDMFDPLLDDWFIFCCVNLAISVVFVLFFRLKSVFRESESVILFL